MEVSAVVIPCVFYISMIIHLPKIKPKLNNFYLCFQGSSI